MACVRLVISCMAGVLARPAGGKVARKMSLGRVAMARKLASSVGPLMPRKTMPQNS